jgi:hypothetical protein
MNNAQCAHKSYNLNLSYVYQSLWVPGLPCNCIGSQLKLLSLTLVKEAPYKQCCRANIHCSLIFALAAQRAYITSRWRDTTYVSLISTSRTQRFEQRNWHRVSESPLFVVGSTSLAPDRLNLPHLPSRHRVCRHWFRSQHQHVMTMKAPWLQLRLHVP